MKSIILILAFALFCIPLKAQWMSCNSDRIKSMELLINDEKMNIPIMELSSRDVLTASFDDITRDYHRYVYTIEHCDFNWKKSTRIFESDYLQGGIRKVPIENYAESVNTTVEYIHYSFSFPNEKLGILYSGNYRIRVYDDDSKEEVCSYCFSVVENLVNIDASATTNTEIDWNKTHQQLKISLNAQSLNSHDPNREIKMVVIQNGRWDKAVWNPTPDYITPSEIKWTQNRDLIFDGGNEFRKFEMTNVKTALMGMDVIKWFRPYYHATLFTNEDCRNYIYTEDQNGKFYVRTTESNYDDTEADYLWVHFLLKHKPEPSGDLYVFGELTNWCILPEAKMKYDTDTELYEAAILLKEGYYNYQYIFIPKGTSSGETARTEGNFFQTENEYTVLVYYSQRGSRYDRLVGIRNFSYSPSK